MIELLAYTQLNEKQLQYLTCLKICSTQLMDTLNDILDFSRITNGGMKLTIEPMSINKCIDSVICILNNKANEKKLNLKYSVDLQIPDMVMGDSIRLKQVLMNIITNSIKFTKCGNIDVFIKFIKTVDEFVFISITVKDTGIGIPKNMLDKIFERFT